MRRTRSAEQSATQFIAIVLRNDALINCVIWLPMILYGGAFEYHR